MNMLIIGNGFDRGHGLKTSYWNSREYLEKYEEDFLFQMERMYDFAPFERKDNRNRKNKQTFCGTGNPRAICATVRLA